MKKCEYVLLAVFLVAALAGGFWFFHGEDPAASKRETKIERKAAARAKRIAKARRGGLMRIPEMKRGSQTRVDVAESKRPKPTRLVLDDEEAKLTALGRQILAEIRAALDEEDFKTLSRLVGNLAALRDDDLSLAPPGGLVHLRRAAISALGWFGSQSVPELVGFLGDFQPEVREAAEEQFRLALEDIELSDYDRARIVVEATKVATSEDFVDMLMMEIGGPMRNSVAASTLAEIMQSGSPASKAKLAEAIEFVTGEEGLSTRDDLERWLQENPDGPDDDDLYGRIESY